MLKNDDKILKYEPLWGLWKIQDVLGEGGFGRVYLASRNDSGQTDFSAIKLVSIPQKDEDIKNARMEGMDDESMASYFRSFVDDLLAEIRLMSSLKGITNIVSIEDYLVKNHEGNFGWDILIRMEYLMPFTQYMASNPLSLKDIAKLGIDICSALEHCKREKIIHRDIKPDNIFVSRFGDYKLGDFGIAKKLEKTMSAVSQKGTYSYMAPEVFKGQKYGASVDTYSLGLVLYKLMNDNRLPYLPKYPNPISYQDRENAMALRMKGEEIALPSHTGKGLENIVLKACAFRVKDRYSSPTEMKNELESIVGQLSGASVLSASENTDTSVSHVNDNAEQNMQSTIGINRRESVNAQAPVAVAAQSIPVANSAQYVPPAPMMPFNTNMPLQGNAPYVSGNSAVMNNSYFPPNAAVPNQYPNLSNSMVPSMGYYPMMQKPRNKFPVWAIFVIVGVALFLIVSLSVLGANGFNSAKPSEILSNTDSELNETDSEVVVEELTIEEKLNKAYDEAYLSSAEAFVKHYVSYINAINAQNADLIEYCDATCWQKQSAKISSSHNSPNTYSLSAILIDNDSFVSYIYDGRVIVTFNAICQGSTFYRSNGSYKTALNSTQVVTLAYSPEQDAWFVTDDTVNNRVKLGSNVSDILYLQ